MRTPSCSSALHPCYRPPMWRAVFLMLIAMSFIPLGDTAGKLLTAQHGIAPIYVAFTRFAVGALIIAPFAPHGTWNLLRDWRIWGRAMLLAGGITCILTALRTEPIANVFGAFFIGPLVAYGLSVRFLGEKVTPTRTILVVCGFLGVLLVVQPGPQMSPNLLFAVAAGVFYGAFLTASRALTPLGPPRALLATQLVIPAVLTAPFAALGWPDMNWTVAELTLWSAVASMTGNLILLVAFTIAPATRLAPLVYFQLLAATALGWAVFGTLPGPLTLLGLAVIVAAGIGSAVVRR